MDLLTKDVIFLNIFRRPSADSLNFVLTGLKISQDKAKGFLLSIDFSNFFKRECILDDTEKRYLTNFQNGCILGQRRQFWFKLPDRICRKNPAKLMSLTAEICNCKLGDFECLDGFIRDAEEEKCVPKMKASIPGNDSARSTFKFVMEKLSLSLKVIERKTSF